MSDYVVSDGPCDATAYMKLDGKWGTYPQCVHRRGGSPCRGCMFDGTRVLLDTATPVERRYMSADVPHDARWAWVHTRDEEAP